MGFLNRLFAGDPKRDIERAEALLDKGEAERALELARRAEERAQAAEKLDDPDSAARSYERLISEYPESRYTGRAEKALRKLDDKEDEGEGE